MHKEKKGDPGDPAPDTFIGLSDTPAAYPATVKGQLPVHSALTSLGFTQYLGEDTAGPWMRNSRSYTLTILNSYIKKGEVGSFYATTAGDYIRLNVTANSSEDPAYDVEIYIDGVLFRTLKSDDQTNYLYFTASGSEFNFHLLYTGEGSFSGAYSAYRVESVDTGVSLQLKNNDETIANLEWFQDDTSKRIVKIGALAVNISENYVKINNIKYPTTIPATTKQLVLHPDGVVEAIGMTGLPEGIKGDILYYDDGWKKLAKGTNGHVLKLTSGLPVWAAESSGGSIPGTEELTYAATVTINWNGNTTKYLEITGDCDLILGTTANYVVRVEITGNYALNQYPQAGYLRLKAVITVQALM